MKRILLTGSSGCIGKATVKHLLSLGVERIYGYNRTEPDHEQIPDFEHLPGDISDTKRLNEVFQEVDPDCLIHLAALQTPDCQAQPFLGMEVNLLSTAQLFKTAALYGKSLKRFVFASSAAVHGPRDRHPQSRIGPDASYNPPNLYGFWKIAGEGMAQAFNMETQISTICLRLATTYGPGRDLGLTSASTTALKARVLGLDYTIPYHGNEHYHFVEDVGLGFAVVATSDFNGYGVFHLPGETYPIEEYCKHILNISKKIGLETDYKITYEREGPSMNYAYDLAHAPTLKIFPKMKLTPLIYGIEKSLLAFKEQMLDGRLSAENII